MKLITYVLLFFIAVGSTFGACDSQNDSKSTSILTHSVESIKEAPYMAMVRGINSKDFSTAVIITKRYLLSGASFLKLHKLKSMHVLTGMKDLDDLSRLNQFHDIRNIFYAPNSTLGLIQLQGTILFSEYQRPISLLIKNVLNLNLYEELKEGKKLKALAYARNYIDRSNETSDSLTYITFCKSMNVNELTKSTIKANIRHSHYRNGGCLIINDQLAGISDYLNELQTFGGDFSGIPYYFSWISSIIGYQNLFKAFYQTQPEK